MDPKEIIEESTGRLIDDGIRTLHHGERILRGWRSGRTTRVPGRWIGFGFLSKIWNQQEAEEWLKEHIPKLKVMKWLKFETEES